MSLLRQGKAQMLTIYLGESDQWQGTPLYVALIQMLRNEGCAGVTATRAVAGFGAGTRLHQQESWHWSSDAPIILHIADQPERLHRLLPRIQTMMSGGLITVHDIDVVTYTHARRQGLPMKLLVGQVMETTVTTVYLHTPVAEVVDLLLSAPFRALPVIDAQKRLQGIISTGDLIVAGIFPMRRGLIRTAMEMEGATGEVVEAPLEQARHSPRRAQDIMNRHVQTAQTNQSIREAARIMIESGVRRLPVVESDGTLAGMLTRADLLHLVVTSPLTSPHASSATQPLPRTSTSPLLPVQQQPVAHFMNTAITTVEEHTPLSAVIDALITSPLKRVIVIDSADVVRGIISDVDVLARVQEEARPGLVSLLTGWARGKPGRLATSSLPSSSQGKAQSAADVMNRDVITVTEHTTIQDTIERMLATGRKFLPVVDGQEKLLGVVGRTDLLRVLFER